MSVQRQFDASHSLHERICHALRRQPHLAGRRVACEIREHDLVLTGSVATYFQKQMAQETLRPIAGARRIVNALEVIGR